MTTESNHPGQAAVFSFIFNGLGQIYNGQIFKGLCVIAVSAIGMLILVLGSVLIGLWILGRIVSFELLSLGLVLFVAGLVLVCALGVYSIWDAYRVAKRS